MPWRLMNTVGEREAMGRFRGSMPSSIIEIPIEAARERRRRRQSGSAGWRNMFLSHGKRFVKQ
jgi:hypothetical protein